jgi:hypothetical protein
MLNPLKLTDQDIARRARRRATPRDRLKSVAALCVTAALLWYMIARVGWRDVAGALGRVRVADAILIFTVSMAMTIGIHTDRMRMVLRIGGCAMPWRKAIWLRMGTLPLALVLPAKSGDLLRAFYLRTHHGAGLARGAGIIIAEKMLALSGTLTLIVIGAALGGARRLSMPWVAAGAAAAGAAILVAASFYILKKGFLKNAQQAFPPSNFNASFPLVYAYGVVALAAESMVAWMALRALGEPVRPAVILFYIPLVQVAALMPFTMRGLGIREAGYWALMSTYASQSALVSAGLIASFCLYALPTLIGFLFMNGFMARSFPPDP